MTGKLECDGLVGHVRTQHDKLDAHMIYELRLHEKAPFGVVSVKIKLDIRSGGKVIAKGTFMNLTNRTLRVNDDQYAQFTSLLLAAEFTSMTPREVGTQSWYWNTDDKKWYVMASGGTDGAQWVLEKCSDNEYLFVDRSDASQSIFGKACLYLVELAGIQTEAIY